MARAHHYIHRFRIRVARQLAEGHPEAELARDLGISRKLLRDWQRLAGSQASASAKIDTRTEQG